MEGPGAKSEDEEVVASLHVIPTKSTMSMEMKRHHILTATDLQHHDSGQQHMFLPHLDQHQRQLHQALQEEGEHQSHPGVHQFCSQSLHAARVRKKGGLITSCLVSEVEA